MHPCGRHLDAPLSRRDMLARSAGGFGSVALASLFGNSIVQAGTGGITLPHHVPRARSVIFLYMDGGPSQMDTFDPKPRLIKEHGNPFPMQIEATQFDDNGMTLQSPWKFSHHGECGHQISELFPHVATCADELCIVRSMTSKFSEHTNANYFLHTGLGLAGRPSMGAWASYGLGSETRDLPSFVVLNGGLTPPGGLDCFSSGFLPATHQGSVLKPDGYGMAHVTPAEVRASLQERKLELTGRLDDVASGQQDQAIEAAIANQEMAFRMQWAVPELMQIEGESKLTRDLYGLDASYEPTKIFGRQCLLARRLVERGVRFVELTCPAVNGDRWDQHNNLREGHENNARAVDQPIAGLLKDLRARGLLDETLVVWAAEFGRTPFAQGSDGRDHNPFGYSIWLAGGGVQGGMTYGSTDEFGYRAEENPLEVHDLHATMLHLLGLDHTRLSVPVGGRDMRLTDVHGHVVSDILI
ncbi:MAG: sulfatase [Phycisphaerae bacterium]|nr:sulfatase [Phycisphaerae bacterium]